jgi:hypothetical protein
MMEPQPNRAVVRSTNQEVSMLGRIVAITLAFGGLMTSNAALAQDRVGAAVAAGVLTGVAVATGIVPLEHREPLHQYIVQEHRPSYQYDRYDDEVAVGRDMPPGAYESYPVPEQYGVPEHHYTVINNHPVIYHPQTRRIVHVY